MNKGVLLVHEPGPQIQSDSLSQRGGVDAQK